MRELSEMTNTSTVYYEPTGSEGRYVRVYLSVVADSLITAEPTTKLIIHITASWSAAFLRTNYGLCWQNKFIL